MLGSACFMIVAAIAALPALVAGMRPLLPVPHSEDPTNPLTRPFADPVAKPLAAELSVAPTRHIQYLNEDKAGLSDRLSVFTFLNHLAHFHNAIAYIPGGMAGARRLLDGSHSASIAISWSFYLDTSGNGGNPFHSADKTRRHCRTITDPYTDWARIFDDGGDCVNIPNWYYGYDPLHTHKFHSGTYTPRFSSTVTHAVHKALEGISGEFGLLHIRRCDRLDMNQRCTDPDYVKALLLEKHSVTSWLVFTYAEIGYTPALQKSLKGLAEIGSLQKRLKGVSSRHFAYEDDIFSGIQPPDDNYLRYAAMTVMQSMAKEVIELRKCKVRTFEKLPDNWVDKPGSQTALWKRGVCSGAAANGPYTPRSDRSTHSANSAKSANSTKHKALEQLGERVGDGLSARRLFRATG